MHAYWREFLAVAVAHLLAVSSPGPDFAIVLKQSIAHGRRVAIWTAIGVGTAILLHVGYSVLGLGLLIRSSETWFTVVKYAGTLYIGWLGIQSLRAKPRTEDVSLTEAAGRRQRGAFATGFFTNALNPKVTLFFIVLFVRVVDPRTPKLIQAGYGLYMSLATMAWFTFVAVVFTQADIRQKFLRHGHWIDRALGVVFLAFAVSLAFASIK
jgi:RhtB (resistance to homoserine/threonine) family protein